MSHMSQLTATTFENARPLIQGLIRLIASLLILMLSTIGTGYATANADAKAAAPKAYIGLFKDNAVAVLDTDTNRVLRTVPVPAGPHGLVLSPNGRTVYVSSDGDSKVSLIDTATDKVRKTIEVGKTPHGLALTPDGRQLLVGVFGTGQVAFIDTASDRIVAQVPISRPHNIAISPDGHTAYVASQVSGTPSLVIVDVGQRKQTGSVPLDKMPRALNFSPDGKALYFTLAGVDAVQVLDPASNKIVTQVAVGASPHHPLFTPDGEGALVVDQGPGELAVLNPISHTTELTVTVGKLPHWIAVLPSRDLAYVTNEGSNDVSVVDLGSYKVTATIPVGNAPRKIVVQPGQATATPAAASTAPAAMATHPAVHTSIKGFAFEPKIEVVAGQPIVWKNDDPVPHALVADDHAWQSGELAAGASYTLTLSKPGTYTYHCSIHPHMTGVIVVRAAS